MPASIDSTAHINELKNRLDDLKNHLVAIKTGMANPWAFSYIPEEDTLAEIQEIRDELKELTGESPKE